MKNLLNKRAFTLIELIVSILVIGILVLLAAPRLLGHSGNALKTALIQDAKQISSASERYYMDHGEWPYVIDDYGDLVEAGNNGLFEILYKTQEFDDNNQDVIFYEINFEELNDYLKLNHDEGYFVAAVGNPEFGITALEPKHEETQKRVNGPEIEEVPVGRGYLSTLEYNDDEIVFYGLGKEAYDGNFSTSHSIQRGRTEYLSWNGDLTDRVINIRANGGASSSYILGISFVDKNNKELPFINENGIETYRQEVYGSIMNIEIVVPYNTQRIKFTSNSGHSRVHNISVPNDDRPFVRRDTIKHESLKNGVTLNWPEEYKKVIIYEGDNFLSKVNGTKYTHNPLYSNSEHEYKITLIDKNGVGVTVNYEILTLSNRVNLRGLSPEAFDGNDSTSYALPNRTEYVTWDEDLENRVLTIDSQGGAGSSNILSISFLDKNGNDLKFIDESGQEQTRREIYGRRQTIKPIVPEGTTKIKLHSNSAHSRVYNIQVSGEKRDEINSRELSHNTTDSSITLNWQNYSRAIIYEDGEFLVDTSGKSYTHKPLYSNSTHIYNILLLNDNGVGSFVTYTATTESNKGDFRGLSPEAFDGNASTSYHLPNVTEYVTWRREIENKEITIDSQGGSGSSNVLAISFLDKNGRPLEFLDESGKKHTIKEIYGRRQTIKPTVPEGTTKIRLHSNSAHSRIYNIQVK